MVWQIRLRATPTSPPSWGSLIPRLSTMPLNCWRFSPRWMASMEAPMSSTP